MRFPSPARAPGLLVCQFSVSLCSTLMTKTDMAKLPGLFLRGNVYQLPVVVPLDLQPTYNGRSKLIQSLDTSSHREAALRATQERAKILEEFADKRRALQPQKLDSVTPEMASELAQRVRAGVLRMDEASRDSPAMRDALRAIHELVTPRSPLEALTIRNTRPAAPMIPRAIVDSLTGMSEGGAAALAGLNDLQNKEAGVRLAQRNLASMLPLVKEEAHKLGLTFDPSAPGAREALQQALKAYRLAWQDTGRCPQGADP